MAFIKEIQTPDNIKHQIKNTIIPVAGTQTASTENWTGNIDVPVLYDGLTIAYFLPWASPSSKNVTLNLTLSDGTTTTGAINCYYSSNRLTTHYAKGMNIIMTYWSAGSINIDGTPTTDNRWVTQADYNSNTDTKVRQTLTDGNTNRPILLAYSANTTTTGNVDNICYRDNDFYYNSSTNLLTVENISGTTFQGYVLLNGKLLGLKATNLDRNGEAVTSNTWGNSEFYFLDKDGERIGFINVQRLTTGEIKLELAAENEYNEENIYNTLDILVGSDGTRTYKVSSPENFRTALDITACPKSGTANRLAYYSSATQIDSSIGVTYNVKNSTASTPAIRTILGIFGATYGNTAASMISGVKGLFSYGDGGPQINFGITDAPGENQNGALIFTDHDSAATGASWHFVSNQTDWNVTSKRFHAKTSMSIGTDLPVTTYALNVTGGALFTDSIIGKNTGGAFNLGRNYASIKKTEVENTSKYYPIFSVKALNSDWTIGTVGNDSKDKLYIVNTLDSNYTGNSNKSRKYTLPCATSTTDIKSYPICFGTSLISEELLIADGTSGAIKTSGETIATLKTYVDNAIDSLPKPMVFKGTLGAEEDNPTITDLPTASGENEGDTYKVITAGTYASIEAKVGDVFTSNGVEWILIPAGDDVEDTWRSIKVNGTEKLGTGISSGGIDFVNGTNTTVNFNASGNKISIDSTDTNTTYTLSRNNKEIVLTDSDNTTSSVDAARVVFLIDEDLNTVVLPGFYNAGGGNRCTNTPNPSSASAFGLIVLQTGGEAWYYQFLNYCGTTTTYRRARNSNTTIWTDWIEEKITDEKVKTETNSPTTATDYYPTLCTSSTTGTLTYNARFKETILTGTASDVGYSVLNLGNSTATGTAGNAYGMLRLYAEKSGYGNLKYSPSATGNSTHYLPTTGGTLWNSGANYYLLSNSTDATWSNVGIDASNTSETSFKMIRWGNGSRATVPNYAPGTYTMGISMAAGDKGGFLGIGNSATNAIVSFGGGTRNSTTLSPQWYWKIQGTNEKIYNLNNNITNITRNGTTFTATKADGDTFTFTQQDKYVDQGNTTTDNWRHIILGNVDWSSGTEPATTTTNGQVYRTNNIRIKPSVGQLYIKGTSPQMYWVDTAFDLTASNNGVDSGQWRGLRFQDKNGNNTGALISAVDTNNITTMIRTYNKNTGGTESYEAFINLIVNKTGAKWINLSQDTDINFFTSRINRDGTAPSSRKVSSAIVFKDTNNEQTGYLRTAQNTNGNIELELRSVNENTSGTEVYNIIKLIIAKDGTCSYYVSDGEAFRNAIGAVNTAQATGYANVVKSDDFTWSEGTLPSLTTKSTTIYPVKSTTTTASKIVSKDTTIYPVKSTTTTATKITTKSTTIYPVTSTTTTASKVVSKDTTIYPVKSTTTTATKVTTSSTTFDQITSVGTLPTLTVSGITLELNQGALPTSSSVTINDVVSNTDVIVPILSSSVTLKQISSISDVTVPILSSSVSITEISSTSDVTVPILSSSVTIKEISSNTDVTVPVLSSSITISEVSNWSAGTLPSLSWGSVSAVTGVSI